MVIFWFEEHGHRLPMNVFSGSPIRQRVYRCCYGHVKFVYPDVHASKTTVCDPGLELGEHVVLDA